MSLDQIMRGSQGHIQSAARARARRNSAVTMQTCASTSIPKPRKEMGNPAGHTASSDLERRIKAGEGVD